LGVAKPVPSQESIYDQRLFNQTAGLTSGFASEDSYALYDKPLFQGSSASSIYRPKRQDAQVIPGVETEKIDRMLAEQAPHRGFQGTDATSSIRDGPVKFEKEVDPFGVDSFMNQAKRGHDSKERERETRERDPDRNYKRSRA
jgi:SNW domain-containing protein 1